MWMRNTYIPLDMVFIKPDGVIHRIAENTEPFSEEIVASKGKVTAVLELAGGVDKDARHQARRQGRASPFLIELAPILIDTLSDLYRKHCA